MRTATRIALVLMGTAMFAAATATPGARAERGPLADHELDAIPGRTASQQAQQPPRPDRIDYVRAAEVMSFATAIARLPAAPESANARHGDQGIESRLALAATANRAKKRSMAWSGLCDRGTFAAQQINASDGGRVALRAGAGDAACLDSSRPERRMRQAIIGDMEQMQARPTEPAPVVIKFEAVIRIDLAELGW